MYTSDHEHAIEDICFEQGHVDKVLEVIKDTFPKYFNDFINTKAGSKNTEQDLLQKFAKSGFKNKTKKKSEKEMREEKAQSYINILDNGINEFESDRGQYIAFLNKDALDEYKDAPGVFKSTVLKNKCPIIRHTLQNKRKIVLDKYRSDFSRADAEQLITVVSKLYEFAENYKAKIYNPNTYECIAKYADLSFSDLDTEPYSVRSVIGGGIKSLMLHKLYPSLFPYRSSDAIWALWYLTLKNKFDCEQDSEFLMIDTKEFITQQNYYYPYRLFTFYAHQIYILLKAEAANLDVSINTEYRYVMVDSFMTFIANFHRAEIDNFTIQNKKVGNGHV